MVHKVPQTIHFFHFLQIISYFLERNQLPSYICVWFLYRLPNKPPPLSNHHWPHLPRKTLLSAFVLLWKTVMVKLQIKSKRRDQREIAPPASMFRGNDFCSKIHPRAQILLFVGSHTKKHFSYGCNYFCSISNLSVIPSLGLVGSSFEKKQ